MNLVFCILIIASLITLIIFNPTFVLPALNNATGQAVELSIRLICVYTAWLGILELIKSGGISRLFAKILNKPIGVLFGNISTESQNLITMNLSSNLLGLSSVATPMGIKAQSLLEKENNPYAMAMLFVVACAPIQLIPTSVISLKASLGSEAPSDVVLPILLTNLVCLTFSILLVKVFYKK